MKMTGVHGKGHGFVKGGYTSLGKCGHSMPNGKVMAGPSMAKGKSSGGSKAKKMSSSGY